MGAPGGSRRKSTGGCRRGKTSARPTRDHASLAVLQSTPQSARFSAEPASTPGVDWTAEELPPRTSRY
jgi:hypothetical protein